MMMSKTKKKCWSESFGVYGSTIRVSERDPGGILYLLWVDKSGKQRKRSLGHRDRRRGKKEALALANQLATTRASMVSAPEPEREPLTLAEGSRERSIHSRACIRPGRSTRWKPGGLPVAAPRSWGGT